MRDNEQLNPFPGLRPFQPDEDHLFFGRESETDELLRRLRTNRFVSVLGTSGSGKSSLVRSGLIPSLYSGFMVQAGSSWRVALMRPGDDPIGNLARALDDPDVLRTDPEIADTSLTLIETTLRRSTLGLADCVRQARLDPHENLLIVVDQFEELFRFKQRRRADGHDDAVAFARLLIEAARQESAPVYVVITMRSDFIGDCMEYPDLPDAVNEGQYLIPRMTRDELRAAITGPVAVGGGAIAPRLVTRLLNEVGDDPDQLPVLQHALMRTWDRWVADHGDDEPLDLRHYEDTGTMERALSLHADEAYEELGDDASRAIAETLFKALTDRGFDQRGVRRPTPVREVAAISEVDPARVIEVIERFRQPGRSFLVPPAGTLLDADTVVDISHESLMRCWSRLAEWVDEESAAGKSYLRLCRASQRYRAGEAPLWVDPELKLGLQWRERTRPTAAWAGRYDPGLDEGLAFLEESKAAQDRAVEAAEEERRLRLRRARRLAAVLGSAAVVTVLFGAYAFRAERAARAAEQVAEREAAKARAISDFMIGMFEVSDPSEALGNSITARQILADGTRRIELELADLPEVQAALLSTTGGAYERLGMLEEAAALLEAALERQQRLLGADHPDVTATRARIDALRERGPSSSTSD